jgi:phospholipase/carboxylesterase
MKTVEVAPRGALRGLALVLHGRGATKEDLLEIGELLAQDGWHCVHPEAPQPWGPNGFAWFESDTRARDLPAARGLVAGLVREKQKALALTRAETVVLGFSQGGVVSLDVALNEGVAAHAGCLSGYLAMPEAPAAPKAPLRAFVAHGTQDNLIRVAVARKTKRALEEIHVPVEFHEYEMAHEIVPDEMVALRAWLART